MAFKQKEVFFNSQGLRLEGVISFPTGSDRCPGAIICHPHPQYGGDLYNNVVTGVTQGLVEKGFAALRFNFRGVGRSEGNFDNGVGEVEDVRGAIDFLAGSNAPEIEKLYLVGYSFGAWVGLQAALNEERVKSIVGISPPTSIFDFKFLQSSRLPKLIIFGDKDFFSPYETTVSLFSSLPEPKRMEIIPGADHFMLGREAEVAEKVSGFLSSVL
jgi:alpha/beta superfamily hydrolase